MDMDKYLLAKENDLLERFRGDEISNRIRNNKNHPFNAQVGLLMNIIKDLITGSKEHYAEWEEYEAFREEIKTQVDQELIEMEIKCLQQ